MNPTKHSEISVKRCGGSITDYLDIHTFLDHTKTMCADSRHRILHNHWAVLNIILPVFGTTIVNSQGKRVDVKDLCEKDHLLPDYRGRFIPTLSDFVDCIDDDKIDSQFQLSIEAIHTKFATDREVANLMLSPLVVSGQLKSLLITHNSWFVNAILPRVFDTKPVICNFPITPADLFESMEFLDWMDNQLSFLQKLSITYAKNTWIYRLRPSFTHCPKPQRRILKSNWTLRWLLQK